jgi:transcriptional regulator with XRE-family HTH domain
MEASFEEFREGVAARLRSARGDLTQAQLAGLTDYTQQMISRYENGRIPRSYWYLAGLSGHAGLDIDYILTGKRRRKLGATTVRQATN